MKNCLHSLQCGGEKLHAHVDDTFCGEMLAHVVKANAALTYVMPLCAVQL